jgi:hypothetical protein
LDNGNLLCSDEAGRALELADLSALSLRQWETI